MFDGTFHDENSISESGWYAMLGVIQKDKGNSNSEIRDLIVVDVQCLIFVYELPIPLISILHFVRGMRNNWAKLSVIKFTCEHESRSTLPTLLPPEQ